MSNSRSIETTPPKKVNYAFIIAEEDKNWRNITRFTNLLLKFGHPVLRATESFSAKIDGQEDVQIFEAGSFIIPLNSYTIGHQVHNPLAKLISRETIMAEADAYAIQIHPIKYEFNAKVLVLHAMKVALFADGGSPYPFVDILGELGFQNNFVTGSDIKADILDQFDVLVIPGGGDEGPPFLSAALGEEGRYKLKEFLKKGGAVWGSCAGAWNLITVPDPVVKRWIDDFPTHLSFKSAKVINAEYWGVGTPGIGLVHVKNVNPTHPIMLGLPEEFDVTWHLGPFIKLTPNTIQEASDAIPLIQCSNLTEKWTASEYMTNQSKQNQKGALEDTYAYKGIQKGMYGIVTGFYGLGRVAASGCHPEFGLDWLLEKWDTPARMFVNFIFWAANTDPISSTIRAVVSKNADLTIKGELYGSPITYPPTYGVKEIQQRLPIIQTKINQLAEKPITPLPKWLTEEKAEATFGLTGVEKWPLLLHRINELNDEMVQICNQIRNTFETLNQAYQELQEQRLLYRANQHKSIGTRRLIFQYREAEQFLLKQIRDLNSDINFLRPPEWHQDYGRIGIIALLDLCIRALDIAIKNFEVSNPPYHENPYAVIWDFYLGGIYDLINSKILAKNRINLAQDVLCIVNQVIKTGFAQ